MKSRVVATKVDDDFIDDFINDFMQKFIIKLLPKYNFGKILQVLKATISAYRKDLIKTRRIDSEQALDSILCKTLYKLKEMGVLNNPIVDIFKDLSFDSFSKIQNDFTIKQNLELEKHI